MGVARPRVRDRRLFLANCSGDTFTTDRSGAIAIHTWQVARAARRAGYEPVVVTREGTGTPLSLPDTHFVRWPEPRTRVGRRLRRYAYRVGEPLLPSQHEMYAARLVRRIRRYPPPHRVLFGNDPEVLVHVRERLPSSRLMHLFHSPHPASDQMKHRLVASADALAAVSLFTARECAAEYGVAPAAVAVAYNGVDLDEFQPPPSRRRSDEPLIGFTGTFSPLKGLDLLLDAAMDLKREGKRFRLQLVGDFYWGEENVQAYAADVQRQVDLLRSAGVQVDWRGRLSREDVMQLAPEVDVAVIPSRRDEAFGLVLAEAMACGSATVASKVGGMPEVLGNAGLYFKRGCRSDLAEQLRRLIADVDLRVSLGQQARKRASGFTWDATWSALQPLLVPSSS
jgi:glycosyltransferase involved in cell wall biosynthesis